MYTQTNLPYICFICNENAGDPKSDIRVTLERKEWLSQKWEKSETTQVIVPRCQKCLAVQKKEQRKSALVGGPAMLAGIAALLISIFTKQSDWVIFGSCISVALVVFIIGMVAYFKNEGKIPDLEKAYQVRAAQPDLENYPAISLLIDANYKIISREGKR